MPNLTVQPPGNLVQSERPVLLRVNSEVLGTNTFPEIVFTFDDALPTTFVIITFEGFEFRANDDQVITDPFQFRSVNNARQNLVNAMNNIPVLARDWQIWLAADGLHARRRFVGEYLGLTITSTFAGFSIVSTNTGGGATFGDEKANYNLRVRLFEDLIESADFPSGNYQREFIGELVLNYQKDNQYDFDLSPLLGSNFVDFLPQLASGFQSVPNSLHYYNFEVLEGYLNDQGFPIRFSEYSSPADLKVIFGKKGFVNIDDYWQATPHKPLMTDWSERLVRKTEHQFMIFYYDTDSGNLKLSIDLFFKDGSTITVERENFAIADRGVFYVNVGFDSLALAGEETEFVKIGSYRVKVMDGATNVTEYVTYVPLDFTNDIATIAFQNDFGMYELFSFAGNIERGADYQIATIQQPVPVEESRQSVESKILSNDSQFEQTLYSEGLKKENFDALSELVTSDQVYLIDSGEFVPVIISQFNYGPRDNKDNLYFVNLTITPSQQGVTI